MAQVIKVDLVVKNEISGKLIDAEMEWHKEKIKKVSTGRYEIPMKPGDEDRLVVWATGYDESELILSYDKEKSNPHREIKLIPGTPRVEITIVDKQTGKPVTAKVELFNNSKKYFGRDVRTAPYTIDLQYDQTFTMQVTCEGYSTYKSTIDFKGIFDGIVRPLKIELVR